MKIDVRILTVLALLGFALILLLIDYAYTSMPDCIVINGFCEYHAR
jgi:hypothetical protein